MQPDLDDLNAMRNMLNQSDFRRFRDFLRKVADDEIRRAIAATENQGCAQGRAQMVIWLRDVIETCNDSASAMETRQHDQRTSRR